MKIITGNKKSWVIADAATADDFDNNTAMIVSWCGTTQYDWFAISHKNCDDNLRSNSKIVHIKTCDMADPRFEPLDVIVLHVVQPAWKNAGNCTPKMEPLISFAALQHDFDDPSKTQMLIFTRLIDGSTFREIAWRLKRPDEPWRKQRRVKSAGGCLASFKRVMNGGYILEPGTTFFDDADLNKIAKKFKKRILQTLK